MNDPPPECKRVILLPFTQDGEVDDFAFRTYRLVHTRIYRNTCICVIVTLMALVRGYSWPCYFALPYDCTNLLGALGAAHNIPRV
jgi:hypothetical protein